MKYLSFLLLFALHCQASDVGVVFPMADSSGNGLTSTQVGGSRALDCNVTQTTAPAGVSTSANQTNGTQKTQVVDGSGNIQPVGDIATRAMFVKTKTPLTANTATTVTVAATTTSVVASNTARTGLFLMNTSANTESCAFGASAVLNSGITLYPGGHFEMDEYSFSTAAVNCIGSAAGTTTAVQEYQ